MAYRGHRYEVVTSIKDDDEYGGLIIETYDGETERTYYGVSGDVRVDVGKSLDAPLRHLARSVLEGTR